MTRRSWLILPVAISIAPWIYAVFFAARETGQSAEGAAFVAMFFGMVSFCVTGPLAAAIARSAQEYWIVCAPILAFQSCVPETSIAPLFMTNVALTLNNLWLECAIAAVITIGWYYVVLTVISRLGRPSKLMIALRALGLIVVSSGTLALLVARTA